jgi:photosystem II stability/assembly factor-like uncharacterized protein
MKKNLWLIALVFSLAHCTAPDAHAQWVQATGLYGGVSVTSFAVIGSNVFAGTDGGVYRSADNKLTWLLTPLTNFVTALVVIGPNLFAVTWSNGGYDSTSIFLSTDNGTTWRPANHGLPSGIVTAIFANGTELFVGMSGGGIFRSADTGKNWVRDSAFVSTCTVSAITANGANIVVATSCNSDASSNGVVHSTDDGKTWVVSNNSPPNVWFYTFTSFGATIFAGTNSGVYLTTDNGENWSSSSSGLPEIPNWGGPRRSVLSIAADSNHIFAAMGSYTLDGSLTSNPNDTQFGFPPPSTIDSIYSTTNRGESWTASSSGISSIQVNAFAVLDGNIYAGTPTGIYLSTDLGKNWTEANNGLTSTLITSFAANGKNLFAGTTDGVYISTDSGAEWSSTHSNLSLLFADFIMYPPLLQTGDTNVYAWYAGTFDFSTDNGETWIPVAEPGPDHIFYTSFAVSDANLYAGAISGNYGVYISTDNGTSWNLKSGGAPNVFEVFTNLVTSGDTIFGITEDSIYFSVDNCTSWKPESIGYPDDTDTAFQAVTAFVANGRNLYAVIMDSLFHSTDNGASWGAVGLPSSPIYNLAVCGTNIITGVGDTVYISSDNGANWKTANDGLLEPCSINTFTIVGNYVIAGTSQGVWRRPLSELFPSSAVSEAQTATPGIQNYPNPFSQSTTITFSSPESGVVEVMIVNLLGSEVARIFSGELSAGQHEFTWNADGMPPGMYECVVRMNGSVQQVPMLLIP